MDIVRRKAGRRRVGKEVEDKAVSLYMADELTVAEILKACNISKSTLYRILNERMEDSGKREKQEIG